MTVESTTPSTFSVIMIAVSFALLLSLVIHTGIILIFHKYGKPIKLSRYGKRSKK